MATQIYPYTTPGNYIYDLNKIDVTGGLATLKITPEYTGLVGYWEFEDDFLDSSGQGNNGINYGATFVDGKVDRCLSFNGTTNYIDFNSLVLTDFTKFTVAVWFNTNDPSTFQSIFSQYDISASAMPMPTIEIVSSNIRYRASNQAGSFTVLSTPVSTGWHLVIITMNGNDMNLYLDNGSPINNTFSGTKRTVETTNIGARTYTATDSFFDGLIDEVIIYQNKVLTSAERTSLYNSSAGRHLNKYAIDKPTIEPVDLLDPITVSSWDSFLETLGGANQGSIGYNLYKADKVNKYYWDGSAWITGGSSSNYNAVATINTNIASFDIAPDKIGFIAYLISNGTQIVELDENQITYTINQVPLLNAGSDKSIQQIQTFAPFSDCSFSDPDGTIDHVYYDIEGSGWTEISMGGYGSLLEAVQAFIYQFNNIGDIVCNLKVEDNIGLTSEDSLSVHVSHYTVTFNVKDSRDNHLSNINFKPGDGTGYVIKNSPFIYDYEYNASGWDVIIDKDGYGIQSQNVPAIDHTENFTLIALIDTSEFADDIKRLLGLNQENWRIFDTSYDSSYNLTSATIKIYSSKADCDADTNALATYTVSASYVDQGINEYKVVKE